MYGNILSQVHIESASAHTVGLWILLKEIDSLEILNIHLSVAATCQNMCFDGNFLETIRPSNKKRNAELFCNSYITVMWAIVMKTFKFHNIHWQKKAWKHLLYTLLHSYLLVVVLNQMSFNQMVIELAKSPKQVFQHLLSSPNNSPTTGKNAWGHCLATKWSYSKSIIDQNEWYGSSVWSGTHVEWVCLAHDADRPSPTVKASPDHQVSTSLLYWWC